ncbi:MAG: hypothetical protein ACON4Z_01265 [Planctomycetota bacterium]
MVRPSTQLLAVCGAQRSGTTMLLEALERHPSLEVHHESSPAVMRDFRVVSLEQVQQVVDAAACGGVVIKPLCDSQWVDRMLDAVPQSRALWMFRAWHDVVNSAARKWPGHAAEILAAFRRRDESYLGWRSERIHPDTLAAFAALTRHVEPDDDRGAWAAWWWLRNRHLFDLGLDQHPDRVRPLRYEDLVRDPDRWLAASCAFAGFPGRAGLTARMHARSVNRAAAPTVPDVVGAACDDLYQRLCDAAARAWA